MSNLVKTDQKKYELATKNQFLKDFTVKNCLMKFTKIRTELAAYEQNVPTLASVFKTYGQEFITAYIEYWIDNLNDFINAARKMTPDQMGEIAIMIYQYYPYLNIADLNLVFTRIKHGEFGKLYESIDGVKILEYFRTYANSRANKIEQMNNNNDLVYKQDNDYKRYSDTTDIKTAFKRARGFEIIEKAQKEKNTKKNQSNL